MTDTEASKAYDPGAAAAALADHLDAGPLRSDRPRANITNEARAIPALLAAMTDPHISTLYVRSGGLCWIRIDDEGVPHAQQLGADNLRAYFAEHIECYKLVKKKAGGDDSTVEDDADSPAQADGAAGLFVELEALPMRGTCATILGRKEWDLPALRGIVTAPVLRPDATLLQTPGFDEKTGLYLHPVVVLDGIPEAPTQTEVKAAIDLLLESVLVDFPFVADSDRAQYLAALLSPIIRPYVPGPTPLLIITATSFGSGKTYLADLFTFIYGLDSNPWPGKDDPELRKVITTRLRERGEPAILFDNVPNGETINSAILADLLTKRMWSDRILGSTAAVTMPNDRMWIATGNNLKTGQDMSRRVIWTRLDPNCPNPDQRSGFKLGDLTAWLSKPENAAEVLTALLTLVAGWAAAGQPMGDVRMGGYSRWASTVDGILAWAKIPGFMTDRAATAESNDEETEVWAPLLEQWHRIYGAAPKTTRDILTTDSIAMYIPRNARGELPMPTAFGRWLGAREGRFFGYCKPMRRRDSHTKQSVWWIEKREPDGAGDAGSAGEAAGRDAELPQAP